MDRRNKSDEFFRHNQLAFTNNKKLLEENKENFLMDYSINQEQKQFKYNIFDLNTLIEENPNLNKNFIRTIINRFHDFTIKLMNQNKQLFIENQNLKQKNESIKKPNTNSMNANIEFNANISTEFTPLKKVDDVLENENKFLKAFIDDELECFNQIIIEFNSQFNEMQSKEDGLRKQIIDKCDEITRLNNDIEDLKKNKVQLITELQNFTMKLNDAKRENHKLRASFRSGINSKPRSDEIDYFDEENQSENIVNEDIGILMNNDNNVIVVKKLMEENNQLKDILSKMKEAAFKSENDINELMNEYENLENFKKFILTNLKTISENTKDFKLLLDKFSEKYNKIEFNFENI